jgi:hypothetical protein
MYNDLGAVHSGAMQITDLRWFDLPYAKGFWNTESGKPVFQKPSGREIPTSSGIVGTEADTHLRGYLRTAVRVDVARGVFYFLQVN